MSAPAPSTRPSTEPRSPLRVLASRIAVPAAVAVTVAAIAAPNARAQEPVPRFPMLGESLESFLGSDVKDATRVQLNGQALELHAAHSALSPHVALSWLAQACETGAEHIPQAMGDLDRAVAAGAPRQGHAGIGILKDEREDRGAVLCFSTGKDEHERSLGERLGAFLQTQELSAVGNVRYLTVRKEGTGSFVLGTWAEGSLPLQQMFPATGDAAGRDPRVAPRPLGVRRIVSLESEGHPFALYSYETVPDGEGPALYAMRLAAQGFRETALARPSNMRAFFRGDVMVLVMLGDGRFLNLIEMKNPVVTREMP